MLKSVEMHRKILFSMVLVFSCSALWAADVPLNPTHPQTYTVIKGDTLWDIAGKFLTKPWQWPEVWQVNPQIQNPNLIYPGDEIFLSDVNGKPVLGLRRNASGGRNIKLSPTVREELRAAAIPAIPLDAISQFLSRPLVVTKNQIERSPYVVASQDNHLAVGVGAKVYLRGLGAGTGNRYSVFRPGKAYIDPDTGDTLGYEALHIADLAISRFDETSTGQLTWANREVLKGDRVMPQEEQEYPSFLPRAPESAIDGQIISVIDGVSQISRHNVVVINRGTADGLASGHVLAIFQQGAEVSDQIGAEIAFHEHRDAMQQATEQNPSAVGRFFDHIANGTRDAKLAVDRALGEKIGGTPKKIRMPEERAGELLIFRTFERVSYGLVMNTQRAAHVLDHVRNP